VSGISGSSELRPGNAVVAVEDFLNLGTIVASDDPEFVDTDQSVELGSVFEGGAHNELFER